MSSSQIFRSDVEQLEQVPPTPMSEADLELVSSPAVIDTPSESESTAAPAELSSSSKPNAVPASPSSPGSGYDRVASMTDVLNSAPNSPVSKITDSVVAGSIATDEIPAAEELQSPALPPRPLSPMSQAQKTLQEAFPSIDVSVVKAVLIASSGVVDPAFNALLFLSDPSFKPEIAPAVPTVAASVPPARSHSEKQVLDDEEYARRLSAQINGSQRHHQQQQQPSRSRRRYPPSAAEDHARRQALREHGRVDTSDYDGGDGSAYYGDREYSFFDDDLPVIKENLSRGLQETRNRVNDWVTSFKKKLDGEDEDYSGESDYYSRTQKSSSSSRTRQTVSGTSTTSSGRKTHYDYSLGQRQAYDNDPQVLDGNFDNLNLVSPTTDEYAPPRPARPVKSATADDDDEELYAEPPPKPARPSSPRTSGKWEPLKAVEPTPEDNDPFFVGDSDDDAVAVTPGEVEKKQVRFETHE
ncbi:uncharacterized protein V1516DRAFT_670564 [Lipomyces oligophaga]|uniref:uncharacterized protein n=1 Tax=Lipomyces oligophaga TaxID=45792 RepID=UPI0034D0137A